MKESLDQNLIEIEERQKTRRKQITDRMNKEFFSYIPGSPKFYGHLKREIILTLKGNLESYRKSSFITLQPKDALYKRVRQHEKHMSTLHSVKDIYMRTFALFAVGFSLFASFVVLPFFVNTILGISVSLFLQSIWLIPSIIISFFLVRQTINFLGYWAKKNQVFSIAIAYVIILFLGWQLILTVLKIPNQQFIYTIATPLIASGSAIGLILPLLFLLALLLNLLERYYKSQKPISFIIHEYLKNEYLFERYSSQGTSMELREEISKSLLTTITIISQHFPKILKTNDRIFNSLSNQYVARVLAGTRSLAFEILLSREKDIESTRQKLKDNFLALATENFGDLYITDPENIPSRYRLSFFVNLLKALIVGVLPLSGVLLIKWQGVITNTALLDNLILVFSGWLIWQLILLIEPEIGERIVSFKEAINLFISNK